MQQLKCPLPSTLKLCWPPCRRWPPDGRAARAWLAQSGWPNRALSVPWSLSTHLPRLRWPPAALQALVSVVLFFVLGALGTTQMLNASRGQQLRSARLEHDREVRRRQEEVVSTLCACAAPVLRCSKLGWAGLDT